jgi:WXG100 family type VII secretion target
MANSFSKQDAALSRGATYVSAAHADLIQQLTALRGRLAGIAWTSGGATAFQSMMARWDDDARRILQALSGFEQNLRASETTYDSTDQTQEAAYARMAGRLG